MKLEVEDYQINEANSVNIPKINDNGIETNEWIQEPFLYTGRALKISSETLIASFKVLKFRFEIGARGFDRVRIIRKSGEKGFISELVNEETYKKLLKDGKVQEGQARKLELLKDKQKEIGFSIPVIKGQFCALFGMFLLIRTNWFRLPCSGWFGLKG